MKLGRNDPCHCGSGKKYKQCHWAADTAPLPGELAWRRMQPTLEKVNASLMTESDRHFGPGGFEVAWEDFNLTEEDQTVPFDEDSPFLQLFVPWFLVHWLPKLDRDDEHRFTQTVAEAVLNDAKRRIDPLARRYIEACLKAPFTFYEVTGGIPGRTMKGRDLFLGGEFEVFEPAGLEPATVGELLYGKVVTVDEVSMIAVCSPIFIDGSYLPNVMALRDRVIAESPSRDTPFSAEQLLQWDDELRKLYFQIIDEAVDALSDAQPLDA
jgi:SEC-C motif